MGLFNNLDILSLFHFLIYFVIGIFIKDQYTLIIIISVLWECFEYYISRTQSIKNKIIQCWPIPFHYWNDSLEHSLIDIFINILGYSLGNNITL